MGKFNEKWRGDRDSFELINHVWVKWDIDYFKPKLPKT